MVKRSRFEPGTYTFKTLYVLIFSIDHYFCYNLEKKLTGEHIFEMLKITPQSTQKS